MSVRRLYIVCEGQTEETFVNLVLTPHFWARLGLTATPLLLRNKRKSTARIHKGGLVDYRKLRDFLHLVLAQNHSDETWFTTLLDLYALPTNFPGMTGAPSTPPLARVVHLEQAFGADVTTAALWRFTPYIQLHEFEALLLAEPSALVDLIPDAAPGVQALAESLAGLEPEEVDEGPETAPSKRIIAYVPQYQGLKAVAGPLAADHIGLPRLRAACPHFNSWLDELEQRCV